MDTIFIFSLIILIFSVIIHELAHGYTALWLGDPTAKFAGRLTLNPISHIDIMGSIIVPFILIITNTPILIGWAKPVPFNPYNLRNQKWGELMIAVAGPLSNIAIAVVFGLFVRFGQGFGLSQSIIELSVIVVLINLVLAIFNLVPIPPLDGSKILFSLIPKSARKIQAMLEGWGLILVFVFVFFLWQLIFPAVIWLAQILMGVSL